MIKSFRNPHKLIILALALVISVSACKSSKKAKEAAARAAEEKARIEREASLRKDEEAQRKQREEEEKEKAARDAQARQATEKETTPYVKLNQYFEAIAGASSPTAANSSIQEALGLFASEDALVLIVISGTGDQKDYDRPTSIKKYLNYLKDQKKNVNRIEKLQFDSSGKILEVELAK